MSQPATKWTQNTEAVEPGRVTSATVMAAEDGAFTTDRGEAQRAAGCLLEPAVDDRVLVASVDGELWILSVLERGADGPQRWSADGEVNLVGDKVRVQSREGIDLGTPGPVRITSGRLEVTALAAKVLVRQLHALGERAKSEITKVEVVAESVDTLAERVRQRAKRVMRFVEGLDQLRAGHVDTRADGIMRQHAHDQVVTADGLVKVDGTQVHIG